MKTTISSVSGQEVPRTKDLNIKPLIHGGKPVTNGNGNPVMDDRWIYVRTSMGQGVINLWRARYCEKMYLSEVKIQDSIGVNKLLDNDLADFIKNVSDKLVFEKHGKWYRIYLRKINSRRFGIKKVTPYNFTIDQNTTHGGIFNHNLCVDWRSLFYVN